MSDPLLWRTKFTPKAINKIEDSVVLGKKLGSGAFGTVYEGTLKDGGTVVAVKEQSIADASSSRLDSLKTEIEALYNAKTCSEQVPQLYDVLYDPPNQKLYLIMDLVRGVDLYTYIYGKNSNQKIANPVKTDADAMPIVIQLLKGLQCLHNHNIAHRDVKLANAMIDPVTKIVKWVDFGLSCIVNCPNGTMGTPSTMAPEVMARNVMPDKWRTTDVWSFGCMIYEMITQSKYPFQMSLVTTYRSIKNEATEQKKQTLRNDLILTLAKNEKPNLSQVTSSFPKALKLIEACLIVDPDERWKSWKNIIDVLLNEKLTSTKTKTSKVSKVYADTPNNRALKRVGLIKTKVLSAPRVYADTAVNRKKGIVGKPIIRQSALPPTQTALPPISDSTKF